MNVAFALNENNEAMIFFDGKLGFVPGWVECSADDPGIQIIGESGESISAGKLFGAALQRLLRVSKVVLIRLDNDKPAEGFQVPLIAHSYDS
jgi:hypothetical protein